MQSYLQLHNTVHYITDGDADGRYDPRISSPRRSTPRSGTDAAAASFHVGGTAVLATGRLNPLAHRRRRRAPSAAMRSPATRRSSLMLLHHLERISSGSGRDFAGSRSPAPRLRPRGQARGASPAAANARVVFNYGLTEAMRTCLNPLRDHPDKLNSVGRPSPSVEVRIADAGWPRRRRRGEIGEVLIRGGNLASGYWKKDEMWKARFHGDWYRSGDLGYLDADGFVFLQGRIDHAINCGGKTIALSEVESLLRSFFTNTIFVACGMNDPKGVLGEVVVLGIEGEWREPLPWSELRIKMFETIEPPHGADLPPIWSRNCRAPQTRRFSSTTCARPSRPDSTRRFKNGTDAGQGDVSVGVGPVSDRAKPDRARRAGNPCPISAA